MAFQMVFQQFQTLIGMLFQIHSQHHRFQLSFLWILGVLQIWQFHYRQLVIHCQFLQFHIQVWSTHYLWLPGPNVNLQNHPVLWRTIDREVWCLTLHRRRHADPTHTFMNITRPLQVRRGWNWRMTERALLQRLDCCARRHLAPFRFWWTFGHPFWYLWVLYPKYLQTLATMQISAVWLVLFWTHLPLQLCTDIWLAFQSSWLGAVNRIFHFRPSQRPRCWTCFKAAPGTQGWKVPLFWNLCNGVENRQMYKHGHFWIHLWFRAGWNQKCRQTEGSRCHSLFTLWCSGSDACYRPTFHCVKLSSLGASYWWFGQGSGLQTFNG